MQKTIDQYEAEIAKIRQAAILPGVTADEQRIYDATILRIQRIIDAAKLTKPAEIKRPRQIVDAQGDPVRTELPGPPAPRAAVRRAQASAASPAISAPISAEMKRVEIDWGHGKVETLTEGECRGRFTTALRDLAKSRMARLERFDDIGQYIMFDRACGYYRGLIEFWGEPPTAFQLDMHPLGRVKTIIFNMVTEKCRT